MDVFCMNKNVVFEMRLIASCCVLGMVFSLLQFTLDTWGTTARGWRVIRKNATGDILAVLLCVTIMVVCYMVVLEVENNEAKPGETIKVSLNIAFYLVVGAGVNAVIATTLNLLQCTCEKKDSDSDNELVMELMYDDLPVDLELPPMPPAYDL
ncbi:uncharacterized protein LOC135696370 [Rhopilema esculentum]|uniref:uncharacterized protein LOC135696370 n=1 Tax=Rhopilema esculentum TaxID=499914 RepID=UPI0031CF8466